jgi:hypothetical protein
MYKDMTPVLVTSVDLKGMGRKWPWHIVRCAGGEKSYKVLVRKLKENGRCNWGDNIRLALTETDLDFEFVDLVHLAEDRGSVVGYCEHNNEPLGSIKCP